jgi:hypothetical protein
VVYIYIVERTQIYLSKEEVLALDREAKASGRTRSQLIREAIDRFYLASQRGTLRSAIERSRGAWRRKESGAAYVERRRPGRLSQLHDPGR